MVMYRNGLSFIARPLNPINSFSLLKNGIIIESRLISNKIKSDSKLILVKNNSKLVCIANLEKEYIIPRRNFNL